MTSKRNNGAVFSLKQGSKVIAEFAACVSPHHASSITATSNNSAYVNSTTSWLIESDFNFPYKTVPQGAKKPPPRWYIIETDKRTEWSHLKDVPPFPLFFLPALLHPHHIISHHISTYSIQSTVTVRRSKEGRKGEVLTVLTAPNSTRTSLHCTVRYSASTTAASSP